MLLQKRSNGVYYFRWSYPPVLRRLIGKRELIKSLHSSSKTQALSRAGAYYMAVDRFNSIHERFTNGLISREQYDDEAYSYVTSELFNNVTKLVADYLPANLAEARSIRERIARSLEVIKVSKTNALGEFEEGRLIRDSVISLLNSNEQMYPLKHLADNFNVDPKYHQRYLSDLVNFFHVVLERLDTKLNPSLVQSQIPSQIIPSDIKPVVAQSIQHAQVLLSELYKQFINYKKIEVNLSEKMQAEYDDYLKIFLFAIGDQPINTISKRQVRDFLVAYEKLPKRNLKMYKGRSISELWGLVVPEEHRIATRTMLSVRKFLMGMFRFAVNQEYLTVSPLNDLDIKIKLEQARGNYLDSEVRKIFSILDTDPHFIKNKWQKWAVLFGAYTGARAAEVMNLLKEHINYDADQGVWTVIIKGTKTANALREFPLSPELIEKGFLTFVGDGNGRVFPESKSDKAITSFFPRLLEKAGVPKFNGTKLPRTFHSLRHTVVTKARGANFEEALIQQIVGHEKTSAGVTDAYTHSFTSQQLLPVIQAITY